MGRENSRSACAPATHAERDPEGGLPPLEGGGRAAASGPAQFVTIAAVKTGFPSLDLMSSSHFFSTSLITFVGIGM